MSGSIGRWPVLELTGRGATLLLTLLFLCCSARPDAPVVYPLDRDAAVREVTRLTTVEWARALKEADVAWFQRHLADELMMTTGRTGQLTGKAHEIAQIRPSAGDGGSERIEDLKVQLYDDVAVTTFRIDTTGSDDTGAYHRVARYTEVWVLRDGRWQLAASHSSLVPKP